MSRLALLVRGLMIAFFIFGLVRFLVEEGSAWRKSTAHIQTLSLPLSDNKPHSIRQQLSVAEKSILQNMSSVDYFACCGAGHRLSKIIDANYVAKKLGFSLRTFWGYCDHVEVFHHLFGPQPAEEILGQVNQFGSYVRIGNEVPQFVRLVRRGPNHACPCSMEKANESVSFYRSLRNRFIRHDIVESFMKEHDWDKRTVVGIHIRAGNGETGHFQYRGRAIADTESWLRNVVNQLIEWQSEWKMIHRSIALFVATDTPSMIARLQAMLSDQNISVLNYQQKRSAEGLGVMFGEHGSVITNGSDCLLGWESTLVDMMLLSHSHILVSARPSSFTQSLPMSLVLATPDTQAVPFTERRFCEMNPNATAMRCFRDYADWCCNGTTSFSLKGIQPFDYLRMPPDMPFIDTPSAGNWLKNFTIKPRPANGCVPKPKGSWQECLPYDW